MVIRDGTQLHRKNFAGRRNLGFNLSICARNQYDDGLVHTHSPPLYRSALTTEDPQETPSGTLLVTQNLNRAPPT